MPGVPALLKKDWRITLNLRRIIREQSTFKVWFILLFAAFMVLGLERMFFEGFYFLDSLGGIGLMLVSRLFGLLFLGLSLMLAVSSIVTSFTTFFRAEETSFLLLKPLSVGQITIYKFIQSSFYSSWAFFFTIIPFVFAYGWHQHLTLLFSVWTIVFSIPLVLLCTGVGSILCLLWARFLPRGRVLVIVIGLIVVAGWIWFSKFVAVRQNVQDDTIVLVNTLVPGMRVASNPLWPSWWVAEGIMALSHGQWSRGLLLLGLLVSNVLVIGVLVEITGRACFYEAWQRTRYAGRTTRRTRVLFGPLERLIGFVPADIRALMMKDIRTFCRDPEQWIQGLIFFGLLALYFFNLRNLNYHLLPAEWRNLITFLNIFSVSAVLCSLGSRFVFPQLSLEGHGFWIVGLSPTTMARVLVAKFSLALVSMGIVSTVLMYLSTKMLLVPADVRAVVFGVAAAISLGIAGLSTGLGAIFLDLKQQNPAAIVSGFGGTLNLVLSLVFMFAAIVPFGMVFHLHYAGHITELEFHRGIAVASGWLVLVTLLSTTVPLMLGARSLRLREY